MAGSDARIPPDFSKLKVPELKDILKKRKISSDGYPRRELVELAKRAFHLYDELGNDDEIELSIKRRRVAYSGTQILLPDPEKLPSSLWSRNLRVLPKLMSGHVIAYAGDLNFYHNILYFLQECPILFKKRN